MYRSWNGASDSGIDRGGRRPDEVVVRTVRHHMDERVSQRIRRRDGLQVEAGVDHVSIHQGQQAGHERSDVAASAGQRSLARHPVLRATPG